MLGLLLWARSVGAEERLPENKALVAEPRGEEPIVIDGRLDEPVWQRAAVGTRFVERIPVPGSLAPEGHEVRVVYDDGGLYVGLRLPLDASRGERPRALELTRDSFQVFDDDAVSLKVDVRRDRRTTVGFVTNAAGTQLDYLALESGKQFRREYDAVWWVATRVEADAWYAEFRLPVAALGIPAGEADRVIGFNVTRDHATRAATYDWSEVPPELGAFAALYYGDITGLTGIGGGRPLVLIPYVLGRHASESEDTFELTGDFEGAIGGDIQFRLLEDLWSELTIFPDFAQVDLDDPIVNFDRFPLFFPERRPFFLTGLQVFDFGEPGVSQLFFSRRIGLDDDGNEVPVSTGLKLYGTVGSWQVGFFQVFTQREGDTEAASWTIGRLRYNFGKVAHLGVLGTLQGDTAVFSERDVPFEPDYAFGADGSLRLIDGRLEFTGFWARSEDTDPDEGTQGDSAQLRVSWAGEYLKPSISVLLVDEGYDPAIGFVRRSGILQGQTVLTYVRRPKGDQRVQFQVTAEGLALRASDGDESLGQTAILRSELRWRSGWQAAGRVSYAEDVVEEEFDLLGERPVEPGRYRGAQARVGVNSPSVRNPFASLTWDFDDAFFGGFRHGPTMAGAISLGPIVRLDADVVLSFVRFDDGFSEDVVTVNSKLRVAPTTTFQTDFIFQLNTVAEVATGLFRLRWRYFPGSDLFLVSRYQRDYGDDERHRFETTLKIQFRYDLLL